MARHEGRVIFVRGALPGEVVSAQVIDASHERYWWAQVTDVFMASPDRITPACPVAGDCGGCDFQHVSLPAQRELKAAVVREQLHRLAGLDCDVVVEPVPGDDGTGWRTRMRYLTQPSRVGLRAWRSQRLVDLPQNGCLIAHRAGRDRQVLQTLAEDEGELQVVVSSAGVSILRGGQAIVGDDVVTQLVGQRRYRVPASSFWQVHPQAAAMLTSAVVGQLQPRAGEQALDLYCGVGLFSGALADVGCQVLGVEVNQLSVEHARCNVPTARFIAGRLDRVLGRLPSSTDLIVLDPPRSGAGRRVVTKLAGLGARGISYVACDPAALARDVATFARLGYGLRQLRAFDLFPMTHHVECVALLEPSVANCSH